MTATATAGVPPKEVESTATDQKESPIPTTETEELKKELTTSEKLKLARVCLDDYFKGRNYKGELRAFEPYHLAETIKNIFNIVTVEESKRSLRYAPTEGNWLFDGEVLVDRVTERILQGESSKHRKLDTLSSVKSQSWIKGNNFFNLSNPEEICFKNCVVNLRTRKTRNFSPYPVIIHSIPVVYAPEAKTPQWEAFVSEIILKEDIPLLQEFMGYCLNPSMPLHRLFWFHGKGRNGKGVVVRTIQGILGGDNCSDIGLSDFKGSRRFALSVLFQKLFNVSSEPDSKYPLSTNVINLISGEDRISAELKNKNGRLVFTNKAKILVVGNSFPKVNDQTDAFWDRIAILKFPNRFIEGKTMIPQIEKNWLTKPEDRSGVVNWMLEGLARVLKNNAFTKTKSTEETKQQFKELSDSFEAWLNNNTIRGFKTKMSRKTSRSNYVSYCEEGGLIPISQRTFIEKIRNLEGITESQLTQNKIKKRWFIGIGIKGDEQEQDFKQETLGENHDA